MLVSEAGSANAGDGDGDGDGKGRFEWSLRKSHSRHRLATFMTQALPIGLYVTCRPSHALGSRPASRGFGVPPVFAPEEADCGPSIAAGRTWCFFRGGGFRSKCSCPSVPLPGPTPPFKDRCTRGRPATAHGDLGRPAWDRGGSVAQRAVPGRLVPVQLHVGLLRQHKDPGAFDLVLWSVRPDVGRIAVVGGGPDTTRNPGVSASGWRGAGHSHVNTSKGSSLACVCTSHTAWGVPTRTVG